MSKNNVRIAIRDSTDSHNVAFFDNKAGIKYKSANLHRFLAGSASILTIKYNSKDIDSIRSGCKLAFRYKNRDYWLNVMNFEKKGFEVELTAYSLGLELNNETRGEHKPANAMSIAEYVAYYDPEHALTIGVNEVSDKRIKLEWTGTDTILARLFSVANSFGAELDFSVELNDDYSLKRQVLNIYKKGNLGTNKVSQPVRVGKELKVINYSDNIKELRTAVRATGKDGLTIDGLDKKIYDNNKELLYYSSGMTVYAPQSRDRFPSVGKGSNDNWIVEDLGETQYETKEALWGYMYGEIQKKSLPEITYEVEGAIEAGIGDTQTLIDDIHFEPELYVQARVSELEDDILTGKVTKSTFINFERKYSQIADILLKQVEALAEDAAPYIIRLSTNNGYIFKNGEGSSTITARLEKYSKDIAATWKWVVDNKVVGTGDKLTVKAEQVTNTMAVTVIAYVNGNEVVRDYMTFSNSDDGVGVESIDRYFTSSDQSDGVTIEGAEWSDKPPAPTEDGKYLWAYDEITYTDGTVTTTKPAAVGANFDVDAFRAEIAEELKDVPNREEFENKISEEIATSKAEIETQIETAKTQAESNAKEYADTINQETAKVAELAKTAADEIKADLVNVKSDLTSTSIIANNAQASVDEAKQDLAEVAGDLNTAKQDLMSHAQQLQTQANAQTELTKRVTTVETTANGTKTTVSELTKTVAQNGKDITSVTNRTKTVEDDLANTKTTLTQVQTTANSTSQKTATLETGLNGLNAKFETLKIGSRNYFKNSKSRKYYIDSTETQDVRTFIDDEFWKNDTRFTKDYVRMSFDIAFNPALPSDFTTNVHFGASPWYNCGGITFKGGTTALQHFDLKFSLSGAGNSYKTDNVFIRLHNTLPLNTAVSLENFNLYLSAVVEDYTQNESDIEQKVAEYKQTADQNYASLQSNLQTLDGTVKQNKSEFDQTASQLKTSISAVEGKIPTDVSTRNLILKSNDFANPHKQNGANTEVTSTDEYFVVKSAGYTANAWGGMSWNMSISEMKAGEQFSILMPVYIDSSVPLDNGWSIIIKNYTLNSAAYDYNIPTNKKDQWFNVAITFKAYKDVVFDTYPFFVCLVKNGLVRIKPPMLVRGNLIPSDYQPAFEDTVSDVTKLNTTLTQTADGLRQLSTQVTSQGSTITSHTNSINSLTTGLNAKVSQSDFNTLSGRVTTAENNITAKANELSSKITSVEGKIPTSVGGRNLLSKTNQGKTNWSWTISSGGATLEDFDTYGVNAVKMTRTSDASVSWSYIQYDGLLRKLIEPNTKYTLSFDVYPTVNVTFTATLMRGDAVGEYTDWAVMNTALANRWTKVSCVLTSKTTLPDDLSQVVYLQGMPTANWNWLVIKNIKLEEGVVSSDWSPAPEDYDSKLSTVQSEFKQTTDSIKASVQSLDNNTVKSSSLTINSDGVVIKAGKSTSDFANAVGSYFSVNQNAINLFSDKINVKGSMIVSGAITSDKIASKQINTAHLNGKIITADVISSNAVTADAIKAGAVTTDKMSANSINGDRITAGTLDAAKIRAGSITASQIASGTITSAQIKTGTISAANIAAGAITSDKIASNSIDASKIAANAISANMITGGQLRSTNGATVFDLNAGTLTFNNDRGYIQRVASDKIFEITTYLGKSFVDSRDYLTSAFNVRKSDNSRKSGIRFSLYNMVNNKPTSTAEINSDTLTLYDSQSTMLISVNARSTWLGNFNMQGWGDIPVAQIYGGLIVKDIGIGGHMKSLLKIVEELCNKTGVMWI